MDTGRSNNASNDDAICGHGRSRSSVVTQGLSLATLARYRKRQMQGNSAAGNRWVEVKESAGRPALGGPAGSGLAVALPSGRRIEIGCGFDARTLAQLLDVLERL